MAATILQTLLIVALMYIQLDLVTGHGRMIEPAARNVMWRYNYTNPRNYNDMGLNCGGFTNQFETHRGGCGVCGDPWQGPRDHEAGGKYARGLVARQYKAGSFINVTLELTSNHMGYFEFRLCPVNDPKKRASKACMDRHLLNIVGHGTRYFISQKEYTVNIEMIVMLPPKLTCSQCVLQWKWVAGQSMGPDGLGGECLGCGNQENFVNCADIAIGNRVVKTLPMLAKEQTPPPPPPTVAAPILGPAYDVVNSIPNTYDVNKSNKPMARVNKITTIRQTVPPTTAAPWNAYTKPVQTYQNAFETTVSPWQQRQQNWQQPTNAWQQPPANDIVQQPNVFRERLNVNTNWNTQSPYPTYPTTDPSQGSYPGYEAGEYPEPGDEPVSSTPSHSSSSRGGSISRGTPDSYSQGFNDAIRHIKLRLGLSGLGMNNPNTKANTALSEIALTLQESQKHGGRGTHFASRPPRICPDGSQPDCRALNHWQGKSEFDSWCTTTCANGECPSNLCSCSCSGSGAWASGMECLGVDRNKGKAMDKWCTLNCKNNNCPSDMCICS